MEQPDSVEGLFRQLSKETEPITALILSHCESVASGILDTSVESLERHFTVNVRASLQLIQEFARQVPEGGGSIIALTSDHTVGNVPYGAIKAALDRIVLASTSELADQGIRANVINPSPVDTSWMTADIHAALTLRQPSSRLGNPQDIGDFVAMLLSLEGAWMNGQLLKVDGGFST